MSDPTPEELDEAAAIEASKQREWLANVGLPQHPDDYNGPCGCDECYRAN